MSGIQEATSAETIYFVMYRGQPIGSSNLEFHDPGMGIASGAFEPMPAYEEVEAVFHLFTKAEDARAAGDKVTIQSKLAEYYQARDALGLTLQGANGAIILTSVIHIVDFGDVGREVVAHITDRGFY